MWLSGKWTIVSSLDMPGYEEMKLSTKLARSYSFQKFMGPEPSLGVPRHNIKNMIKHWVGIWQCGAVLAVLRDRLDN
jgi:hypothetical protein